MKKKWMILLGMACTGCMTPIGTELENTFSELNEAAIVEQNKFQVRLRSAEHFAQKVEIDGEQREVAKVEPLVYGKDTLLYFVNYADDKGWIVLSGDKRTTPIISSSSSGQISPKHLGTSQTWYMDAVDRLYTLRMSNNRDTTSIEYKMWCNLDTLAYNIQPKATKSTADTNADLRNTVDDGGHKEVQYDHRLIDTKIEVVYNQKVPPLIRTKWGQSSPWNECVPYIGSTKKRAYTGCVAVAGAQMLYYFNHTMGRRRPFYSNGISYGTIWDSLNLDYGFYFSDPNPNVWDKMDRRAVFESDPETRDRIGKNTEGTNYVAVLMGYIGNKVNMKYREKSSGAQTKDLIKVYNEFGINAEYLDYNIETIRKSLDNKIPVNISAFRGSKHVKVLFIDFGWVGGVGHAWIIDGYSEKRTKYTYTYEMRPKLPNPNPYEPADPDRGDGVGDEGDPSYLDIIEGDRRPFVPPTTYTSVEHITDYYWYMNFGWDGSSDNGKYYVWENSGWNTPNGNYLYKREIIANFSFTD